VEGRADEAEAALLITTIAVRRTSERTAAESAKRCLLCMIELLNRECNDLPFLI
jgi:hypothetical protein